MIRSTLAKVILFAGVSALLTAVVFGTLLDVDTKAQSTYAAVFTDVAGLHTGDGVRIAGIEVGKVSSITLDGHDARVGFTVNRSERLSTTTSVAIHFANLLGQRFVALLPGTSPGVPLRPGTVIGLDRTTNGLDLTEVFNGFQPLFSALAPDQVNQLTASIIDIFQGQSGTIEDLVAQTATITSNLADRATVIDQVLSNLSGLLDTVGARNTQLGQLVGSFDSLVTGLASSRDQIGSAIDGFSTLATTSGSILHQVQPALTSDIDQLGVATTALSTQQASIDAALQGLPAALNTVAKVLSTGSYANVYICSLAVNVTPVAANGEAGPINVSLIPGVPAPQYPDPIYLPASSSAGSAGAHTAACQ